MTNQELLDGAQRLREGGKLILTGSAINNAEAWGKGEGHRATMTRANTEKALANDLEKMDNRLAKQRR